MAYKVKVYEDTPDGVHFTALEFPSFEEVYRYIENLYLNYACVEEIFIERIRSDD